MSLADSKGSFCCWNAAVGEKGHNTRPLCKELLKIRTLREEQWERIAEAMSEYEKLGTSISDDIWIPFLKLRSTLWNDTS